MKKNYLILGAFILLLCQSMKSQTWNYYKDFPLNVNVARADYDNNGNLYIITVDREIWKKPANGNWQRFDIPRFNYEDIMIEKNTGSIFLADSQRALEYSTNNGQTWQNEWLTTHPNTGFHEPLYTLSNMSSTNVFYAGSLDVINPLQSNILKYTLSGNSISNIQIINFGGNLGFNNGVLSICQSQNGSKVIVGTYSGVFASLNSGVSFESELIGTKIYKIIEAETDTFYALAETSNGDNHILKSIGGLDWTLYYNNTAPEKLTEIFFDNSNVDLWIGTEKNVFKVDNPNTTPVLENKNLNNNTQKVTEILKANQNIYLFSAEYGVQRLNGATWIQELNGFTGSSKKAVIGNNGKIFSIGEISPVFSYAEANSSQWVNTLLPGDTAYYIWNMDSDGAGNVYLTKKDKIFKVNQQGEIFQINVPGNPNPNAWINKFYVAENGHLYFTFSLEENRLYRTIDGGQTWELFLEMTNAFDTFNSFCEDLQGNVYYTTDFNFAEFHYTTNNGATWNSHEIYNDGVCGGTFTGQLFEQRGIPFFVACGTRNIIQLNGGVQLTHVPYIDHNASGGNEPLVVNQNGFYTAFDNVVYKSTNNGQTWQSMSSPAVLAPYPNSIGILSSDDNEIFVRSTSDSFNLPANLRGFYRLTESLSNEEISNDLNASIFPNPANEFVNIQSNHKIERFELYEITGKKIYSESLSNNQIDLSGLAEGMYMLKLISSEGKTGTHKIIKN